MKVFNGDAMDISHVKTIQDEDVGADDADEETRNLNLV